jgi:hypothetical protein
VGAIKDLVAIAKSLDICGLPWRSTEVCSVIPWQCDHGVKITDALKVDKVARIVEGVSTGALVGHKPRAEIVCGGFERSWTMVI